MPRRLVNRYEEIAYGEIKRSADKWGLSVYPMVRLADVISLNKVDATGALFSFGLRAHFDFVICRNGWEPIYAIEFDGRFHSSKVQQERDLKKDELCRRDGFPILRINSKYLTHEFGSISLVAWIIDVYELQSEFDRMQRSGSIPDDEIFDPFFVMGLKGEDKFPYWFSAKPRVKLQSLHKEGKIAVPCSSGFIGLDTQNVMRGIEFIRVTKNEGLFVRSAMRPQDFPIVLSDLFDEILFVQLWFQLSAWLNGNVNLIPMSKILAIVAQMQSELKIGRSHSYGELLS